jgi:hypothetical protein
LGLDGSQQGGTQGYTGVHRGTRGYAYTGVQRSAQAEPLVGFRVQGSGFRVKGLEFGV